MTQRIIIIGAGIGGLCAAAELAHKGYDVTVFEQHAHVGGKMHHVLKDGVSFDTGPTVLTLRHVFDELFTRLGASLDDWVQLRPLDVIARHLWEDAPPLDLYADVNRNEAAIAQTFGGGAAAGYRAFAHYTESLYRLACAPFIYAARPTWTTPLKIYGMGAMAAAWRIDAHRSMMRALQHFFPKTPHLRQLFGRYATYTGGSPWRAPATLNLIAHVERMGVWSVEGGMHALADAVARLAVARGARICLGQPVAKLLSTHGRVCGVHMADGAQHSADAVIFNGDVRALKYGLLPIVAAHHADAPAPKTRPRPTARGLSAVTWGASRTLHTDGLAEHTVLFAPHGGKAEFDALFEGGPPCPSPTVYICAPGPYATRRPSAPDPSAQQRLFCLVNAPPTKSRWRDADRKQATDGAMQRFAACGLQLDTPLQPSDILHTPYEHAARFLGSDGALYGEAPHSWAHFFRRPSSHGRLAGLFLAGGGVHPGAGVPMAALSGRLAAEAVHQRPQSK